MTKSQMGQLSYFKRAHSLQRKLIKQVSVRWMMTVHADLGGPWKNPGMEDEVGLMGMCCGAVRSAQGQPKHG